MKFLSDIWSLCFTHYVTCQIWCTWNDLCDGENSHVKIVKSKGWLFLKELIFWKFESESDHWVNTDYRNKQLYNKSCSRLLTGNSETADSIKASSESLSENKD